MAEEWDVFVAEHGEEVNVALRESFERNGHLYDINDGTHASWHEDSLGVLVVLTQEEAETLASEQWRISEGFATMPAFREFLGRFIEDLVSRSVESRFID